MARIPIIVKQLVKEGVDPADPQTSVPASGHTIDSNDGRVHLAILNNAGSASTVTVETPGAVQGLAIADLPVLVPGGSTVLAGPFSPDLFNQPGTDSVYVDVNDANLTLRAYRT